MNWELADWVIWGKIREWYRPRFLGYYKLSTKKNCLSIGRKSLVTGAQTYK